MQQEYISSGMEILNIVYERVLCSSNELLEENEDIW